MRDILTIVAVWAVSWVEWFIAGKKGLALVQRKPSFSGWVCLEVALGLLVLEAWRSDSPALRLAAGLALVAGALGGSATSGVYGKVK